MTDFTTPTSELVDQWARDHASLGDWMPFYVYIATRAAEWGPAGWASNRWVPRPPAVPENIIRQVEALLS
jgi:hypothetical protein